MESSITLIYMDIKVISQYPDLKKPPQFSAIELSGNKTQQVHAIIGTISMPEAALISEIPKPTKHIPIISLTSPAIPTPPLIQQPPSFFQMANDITLSMQCIVAIVANFGWRKVTAIYQNDDVFSTDAGLVTLLTDSLRAVNSQVETHLAFPPLSSLSDPNAAVSEELLKLRSKSNRVFIILQSSLDLTKLIFHIANQLGMMEKGYVWIIPDEITSFLDSLDPSDLINMQGVIGLKTNLMDTMKSFKIFKTKFRRSYGQEYPEEEEYSNPSVFSLRAYDAVFVTALAVEKWRWETNSTSINITSIDFNGLSGKIRFRNGKLESRNPILQIINVVGRSYREIACWSPVFGLFDRVSGHKSSSSRKQFRLGPVYWPGGDHRVPKGWSLGGEERPLKIGVPGRCAFSQFVKFTQDHKRNETIVSGFAIQVFEAAVKNLPYHLPYEFVRHDISYDELVEQIYYRVFRTV